MAHFQFTGSFIDCRWCRLDGVSCIDIGATEERLESGRANENGELSPPWGFGSTLCTPMKTTVRSQTQALRARDREAWAALFGVDKRSLAVLRIGLSLLLIYNGLAGGLVYPRMEGTGGFFAHPDVVVIPFAVLLLVGIQTRLVTILCWLIFSHGVRIGLTTPELAVPLANYVLSLALFWGVFLPLGARASIDARRRPDHRPITFASVASAGLLIQVAFIYFSGGVMKSFGEWVLQATALDQVLGSDRYGSVLGQTLTQFPHLLAGLSIATIALELIGPILLFVPGARLSRRRIILVVMFFGLQVAMAMFMKLGLFPYVLMLIWCVFLPTQFWDRVTRRRSAEKENPPTHDIDTNRWRRLLGTAALALIVISNLLTWVYYPADQGIPGWIQTAARYVTLYQEWVMFSMPSTL
ncbi:hypothetical protein BH23ACT5_BH23ACT5_24380 [soil metagenome]